MQNFRRPYRRGWPLIPLIVLAIVFWGPLHHLAALVIFVIIIALVVMAIRRSVFSQNRGWMGNQWQRQQQPPYYQPTQQPYYQPSQPYEQGYQPTQQPYYQPSQSYEQGYQPEQQPYYQPPSQTNEGEYEQPRAQYPEQMPPMQQ